MIRFYVLPGLAIIGIILAIRTVLLGSVPTISAPPVVPPPRAPFETFVAGVGIVEAISENIAIASPLSGVVKSVHVRVGDLVHKGDSLFSLDDREALAELAVRKADLALAQATLQEATDQLSIIKLMVDSRAVSKELQISRSSSVEKSRASTLRSAALVSDVEVLLDRLTIRAPLDGRVLQLKTRVGEFAAAQVLATPLLLMGNVETLGVRVDVDENDAWRVKAGAPAVAFVRGNTEFSAPLSFVRFEPYVIPKRSLTGESSERVDTRVLQVIYALSPKDLPVYVGQLLDVFVNEERAPAPTNAAINSR